MKNLKCKVGGEDNGTGFSEDVSISRTVRTEGGKRWWAEPTLRDVMGII